MTNSRLTQPHIDRAADRAAPDRPENTAAAAVFAGGGEVAALCRALDWGATPLGPVGHWPQSLRTIVGTVLASAFPNIILWGPELVQIYNDGYIPLLGVKHPWGLGKPTRVCWPEAWDFNAPIYERVFRGETVSFEDQLYRLLRHGPDAPPDDVYITLSYSPVPDEMSGVGGVLVTLFETTQRVAARRLEAEREQLFRKLEVERARLEYVFRRAPSFFVVLRGPEHVYELANDAHTQLVGHRDIIGKPVLEALPELRGQGFKELLDRVLETGEPFIGREIPVALARTPGAPPEQRFVDFVYQPLLEADGTRSGVVAHGTDVTDHVCARREVERLLGESEAARWALLDANTQLEAQRLELELANQQLQEQATELELQAEELQATAAQLEERTEEAERAAAALAESEQQLRTLADAIPTLAWTARADGFIDWYNARWYEYTGTTPEQMAGWGWKSVHHPEVLPGVLERWTASIATGEPFEMTFPLRGADGGFRWFLTRITPVRDAAGRVIRWFGTNTDVNELREAREQERRARADADEARHRADEANRAKSEFLATMSHELRTPLNAVVGYAQLLDMGLAGPVTEQQRTYLEKVQASSSHLVRLVNDVLDLAKADVGQMTVSREHALLKEALEAALALTLPQAEVRRVRLVDRCGSEDGVPYVGDEHRVRQILVNLLSNAIKFTEPGGTVTVECGRRERASPEARVSGRGPWAFVSVEDTGIGIAPEQQVAVFEPFHQAERGHTRTYGGTGLGLAISRRLARLMGGDLVLEQSAPGRGSRFTLWLPAAGVTEGVREAAAERAARAQQEVVGQRVHEVAEVGTHLREHVEELVEAYVARLRSDPAFPQARALPRSDLEDHYLSLLADLAQSLVVIEETRGPESDLLKDGSEIQRFTAELHGRQRHRLGWTATQLTREYVILGEEVEAVVRRRVPEGVGDVSAAIGVLRQLLDRAAHASVRALRQAARGAGS